MIDEEKSLKFVIVKVWVFKAQVAVAKDKEHVESIGVKSDGTTIVIFNKLLSEALVKVNGDVKVILMVDCSKRIMLWSLAAVAVRVAAW